MTKGDTVRIAPHGKPDAGAQAKVVIASGNGLSIALEFEDVPPFSRRLLGGMGLIGVNVTNGRVTMLLTRERLNGVPWGPWIEVTGGGHYEIDEGVTVQ